MDERVKAFKETYEVRGKVGKGGGGTVFRAYHKRLKKEVVLKKIHSNLNNINVRAETDILKNLKHEYLPQVLDFLEIGGNTFTVMDYIQGKSFKECLDEHMEFSQAEIIEWFKQLCQALMQLHMQNPPIIHGDIKPANIMLTPSGKVCLIDFNIASIFEGKDTVMSGYTPGYAAPEQILYYRKLKAKRQQMVQSGEEETMFRGSLVSEKILQTEAPTEFLQPKRESQPWENWNEEESRASVDVRTDIFCLGATVYHLLTGKKPRQGNNPICDIRELKPDIIETLADVVMKCMEPQPQKRYQSVEELYHAVKNIYIAEKRYQDLLRQQKLIRICLCAGMVCFLGMAYAGGLRIKQEKNSSYLELINQGNAAAATGNWAVLEECFHDASEIFPARPDAYLVKGQALFAKGSYDEAIHFLLETAVPYVTDEAGKTNLQILAASCYFEKQDYGAAADILKQVVEANPQNGSANRDYAVTLIRLGETEQAREILDTAVANGLTDDGIYYANGELAYAQGDMQTTEESFLAAIKVSDDEYMKMRAYMMLAGMKEPEESIDILEEARRVLSSQYLNVVLEKQAQMYIRMAEMENDFDARLAAIEIMKEIVSYQWDSYTTHQNLVILYQKNDMLDEAMEELSYMQEVYGEDYRTYKYLAFVEVAQQNKREKTARNYVQFESYYEKAMQLYGQQAKNNQSDADIEALKRLYQEAKQGGWI